MRITTILTSLAVALAVVVMLSSAAEKEKFTVTIAPNPKLDASFDRKERTKDRGWKVFIKFTNKTDKPIRSIGTDYLLREGGWNISGSRTQTANSSPLLMPSQSAVFGWIDGVPSSVDSTLARLRLNKPNHLLQRIRRERRGCNRGVPWAGSLSLGR